MLLTIPGLLSACGPDPKPDLNLGPVVVDVARTRCAEVDRAVEAEFGRRVPRPAPDIVDAAGRPAVSLDATRRWIDALELAVDAKNAKGRLLIRDYQTCSGREPATTS